MRILVTGGAGFIGSEFVRQTLARYADDQITVLDKLTYAGNLENLEPVASDARFCFVHGDIGDREAAENALEGCQAVVNFAAETHVDRSIMEPDAFVKTDVLGTWTLAEDFASGVDTVLRKGQLGHIYNIGSPEPEAEMPVNLTLSQRVLELLGKPASLIEYVVDRPAHDRRYRVDARKLLGLGWQPKWRFRNGLEATVNGYARQ